MDFTIAGLIRSRSVEAPDTIALTADDRRQSWSDLFARSCRLANALAASGIGARDRVAFVDRNGIPIVEVVFACALINAVPVPVNWRLSPAEVGETIADARARIVIAGAEFQADLASYFIERQELSSLRAIAIDAKPGWQDYEAFLSAQPATDPGISPSAEDVALQLYTSGTTGRPKGILLSVSNVAYIMREISRAWNFTPSDVSLECMPMFHSGGLAWLLAGMAGGARTVISREFSPPAVLDLLQKEKITKAMFIPSMLSALTQVVGAASRQYDLKQINYTGSPITESTLQASIKTFRCNFVQTYGLTEATGAFVQLDAEDHDSLGPRAELLRSAGRPYPWAEVRIVDPRTMERLKPGELGEVLVRSGQNMLGYWNRPEETAKALPGNGWMRTGDGGYLNPEGFLFITDRLKDVIISGGENVFPAEVENVLASHPAVLEVAVIGVPSEKWGETVKAVVVLRSGQPASEADLIAHARASIAHFKCPTSVDFAKSLPRNMTGKLLKNELRQPYWAGRGRNVS